VSASAIGSRAIFHTCPFGKGSGSIERSSSYAGRTHASSQARPGDVRASSDAQLSEHTEVKLLIGNACGPLWVYMYA
jgi:hypothetical protein